MGVPGGKRRSEDDNEWRAADSAFLAAGMHGDLMIAGGGIDRIAEFAAVLTAGCCSGLDRKRPGFTAAHTVAALAQIRVGHVGIVLDGRRMRLGDTSGRAFAHGRRSLGFEAEFDDGRVCRDDGGCVGTSVGGAGLVGGSQVATARSSQPAQDDCADVPREPVHESGQTGRGYTRAHLPSFIAHWFSDHATVGPDMLKTLWVGAALIGAIAVVLVAALVIFQDRLLYLPARADARAFVGEDLKPWPAEDDIRGLLAVPPAQTAIRGTVIVFHGNAGHAGHRRHYLPVLHGHSLRVILAEYPGYGPRTGEPAEQTLVDDAVHTISQVHERFGGPVLVMGVSLGAAVAAAAGPRVGDRIDGLLLITPWNRLLDVAARHYAWLPVRWLLRERWDSVAHLHGFKKPVAVVVAARDEVIEPRFGRDLFDSLQTGGTPVSLLNIEPAGHNDWLGFVDQAWWAQALRLAGLPE